MPKDKEEIILPDPEASKKLLQKILEDTSNDHFAFVETENRVISSSSLLMDSLCKIYSGQIIRLNAKGAELGKTSQSLVFAENYMKTMPRSKTIYLKCEARLSPEMQVRSDLKFVTKAQDWNYGTVYIYPGNIFEVISKMLEDTLKCMHDNGEHLCIIWDSLDYAILRGDAEKKVWDGKESPKVAGVPLLTKLLFKRFALPLEYYGGLLIMISQYTTEIKLDPYSKEPPRQNVGSGGNATNHSSSYTWTYLPRYKSDDILENEDEPFDYIKNKKLGIYATIEVTKSASDVTGTKVKVPIKKGRIGCAIWQEKECVDMAVAYGALTRKGSWYNFSLDLIERAAGEGITIKPSLQGLNKVYEYIENDKEVFQWLYSHFKELITVQ